MTELLNQVSQLPQLKIIGMLLVTFLAAITAYLANRNIAVYNDAVRPLVGQKKKGLLTFKTLVAMSFSMSIGYVVGFIPFSIASKIIIVHAVLLGSEIIGLSFNKDKMWKTLVATALAAIYGFGLFQGLDSLNTLITKISYPGFGWELGLIGDGAFPFVFSLFPAVAAYAHSGAKKGTPVLLLSILTYILVSLFGWNQYKMYPMAITMLVGIIAFFALVKTPKVSSDGKKLDSHLDAFREGAQEIKKNQIWLMISGGIAAAAVTSFAIAPLVSLGLHTSGKLYAAAIADLSWVIGFIPLVVLTSLLTGVYSPVGLTAVLLFGTLGKLIGLQLVEASGNPASYLPAIAIAFAMGAVSMFLEIQFLRLIAKMLFKLPGVQKLSDSLREGIQKTVNAAFLFGGIIAAYTMGRTVSGLIGKISVPLAGLAVWLPSMSAGLVIGLYIINKQTKRKLSEIAVGPVGALMVGVILNIVFKIATSL